MARSWSQWAKQLNVSQDTLERRWDDLRSRLFLRRAGRVPPLRDDKILADLNGLMIAALAEGAMVLETSEYLDAAGRAADFVLKNMTDERGGLRHRFRNGQVAITATVNDYAFFIMGLLGLSRASGNPHWVDAAVRLQGHMDAAFWDPEQGGYHLTDAAVHELPVRPKEVYDGAIPSANAVALHNLIGLSRLTSEDAWLSQAGRLIQAFGGSVRKQPSAYLHTLAGWELLSGNHPRRPTSN
jgi:uncharacterized protein YyaL (SSP411 family)